ncbi:hypothetical protein PV04_09929 [Phialophora macrospora]|uniref:Uncharacterized protein n=1 Tax=Phialophora macrospora TaxID=1851006 RepID=A0A0D2CDC1_9EURO|nr:hypothetical protein PV04_09929 [Phialophora macrospora]
MEDFSQSRGDDDLFDDEIIPFENPPSPDKVAAQLEHVSLEPASIPPPIEAVSAAVPAPQAAKPPPAPTSNEAPVPSYAPKPRGRGGQQAGRGGGGGPRKPSAGLGESKWAAKPAAESDKSATRVTKPAKSQPQEHQSSPTQPETTTTTNAESSGPQTQSQSADDATPTAPSAVQPPAKTPAVRGDRTLTGGLARPKLTEEELSAKLAAAKERSQNVAAAHARAQADAASFEERERIATAKRAVARKERRVMEGEREKNRLRKLGNREGREWDRDKEDVNAEVNGRGGRRGGGYAEYGGQGFAAGQRDEDDLRQYEWHDDRGRGRGRGRGGRGGRGRGRGGPRGGGGSGPGWDQQSQQQPDTAAEADFPALPGSASKASPPQDQHTETKPAAKDSHKPSPRRWDSGGGGGGTWAEQVESSELNGENLDTKSKNF